MREPEFLTTSQVLELLQIGRTKLWELVRNGAFPAYRIGDGANAPLRYRRQEILRWLEQRRVESPATIRRSRVRSRGAPTSS
jgi:excisionase family DNA binding protein